MNSEVKNEKIHLKEFNLGALHCCITLRTSDESP
jgi:hypothetical protein